MRPQPASIMSGSMAWIMWKTPCRLTLTTLSHCSNEIFRNGLNPSRPAELTRMADRTEFFVDAFQRRVDLGAVGDVDDVGVRRLRGCRSKMATRSRPRSGGRRSPYRYRTRHRSPGRPSDGTRLDMTVSSSFLRRCWSLKLLSARGLSDTIAAGSSGRVRAGRSRPGVSRSSSRSRLANAGPDAPAMPASTIAAFTCPAGPGSTSASSAICRSISSSHSRPRAQHLGHCRVGGQHRHDAILHRQIGEPVEHVIGAGVAPRSVSASAMIVTQRSKIGPPPRRAVVRGCGSGGRSRPW